VSVAASVIGAELTIYRVAELKEQLLAIVAAAPDPSVDLSQVAEIDTAGVQLLLLAQREARARGGELHLRCASPAVRDAFQLLGLDAHLHTD
jgi:anti-sigma B factor antagonist